jgi:hypothetical protein
MIGLVCFLISKGNLSIKVEPTLDLIFWTALKGGPGNRRNSKKYGNKMLI